MPSASTRPTRRFQLVLIKPSHYDDDGYVIQWMRAFVPSNTLAVLYSLGRDAGLRSVLGSGTAIDITVIDEIHTRVKIKQLRALFRRHDGFGLVGIVGVQSNQYPRALDIARPFRADGVPVMIGGFHVSGCLAMLSEMQADLKKTLELGISMFAGELEGRMAGRRERDAEADLQLPEGPAVARVRADPHPSRLASEKNLPGVGQLRCRPWLPLSMLVLHHHQRPGQKIAAALGGRRGADDSRALRAGHPAFLHHRRQSRPQQGLGSDLRPDHHVA
jgi:hypothetical protein